MVSALAVILISSQAASQELPALPASAFKAGQEFYFVYEKEERMLTFGGKNEERKHKNVEKYRIIETGKGEAGTMGPPSYAGDGVALEGRDKNYIPGGVFRLGFYLRPEDREPNRVEWQEWTERTDYKAAIDAARIFQCDDITSDRKKDPMPEFSFAPIALLGLKKPGDKVEVKVKFRPLTIKLAATEIKKIDGYDCLEIQGKNAVAYYRLSDGLIQRVKDYVSPEHEFKIDNAFGNGLLGKGTVTVRAYRLDSWPPKK